MGTLYDLLGALPSDDADGLRTAFRKAAKATHPDLNPDNPEAALRFRELVRAYDILTDADQRATYDQLLTIALQPSTSSKAVRTYEAMGKYASNTLAATVISAVLVGGYTLFGHFSKPPGAAEILPDRSSGRSLEAAAAAPFDAPVQGEARLAREGEASPGGAVAASAVAVAAKDAPVGTIGRFEPVPGFASYNLGVQFYPRFATAYFDRGVVLYRFGDFDRPFPELVRPRRPDPKRTKAVTPAPRKPPMQIVPPVSAPAPAPAPDRQPPFTAALNAG